MSRFMVTDLRHLESEDPTVELPPQVSRLRKFLGEIVRAASVRDSGELSPTAVRCRRRPGRKPCKGRIEVVRRDIPAEVEWRCAVCGDGGVVSGWSGTVWDLSRSSPTPTADPEGAQVVEIELSQKEYELLRDDLTVLEPDSERIIAAARPAACDRVVMRGRLDDWDFFMGEIAFDANHTDDRGFQRRLDAIIERLDLALRRATD